MKKDFNLLQIEVQKLKFYSLGFSSSLCKFDKKYLNILTGQEPLTAIIQLNDGNLALGLEDGTLLIFDLKTETFIKTIKESTKTINKLIQLKNGKIICAYEDGNFEIRNYTDFTLINKLNEIGKIAYITEIRNNCFAIATKNKKINLWELDREHNKPIIFFSIQAQIHIKTLIHLSDDRLAFAGDGQNQDFQIHIKNINNDLTQYLKGHKDTIFCLLEIEKCKKLASSSDDKSIRIWDLKENNCVIQLSGHSKSIRSLVQISINVIISSSLDMTIKLWDLNKKESFLVLDKYENSNDIYMIHLRDGRIFVATDNQIYIYSAI